ncbi:MAG: MaoC family dehydratase, partial [Dehalococcoidia bacterium]|nr:MaoC family dehydratase [Dehalococcoidia bacterium]
QVTGPVSAGDTITFTGEVTDKRGGEGHRLVECEVTGANQLNRTVARATATVPLERSGSESTTWRRNAPSRGAGLPSKGQHGLEVVFVGQALRIGRQQKPGVQHKVPASTSGAVGVRAITAEPGEIVSATTANVFRHRHESSLVGRAVGVP